MLVHDQLPLLHFYPWCAECRSVGTENGHPLKERGKSQGPRMPFRGTFPSDLSSFYCTPSATGSAISQYLSRWGVSLEAMGPWGCPLMLAGDGWCTAQLDETLGRSEEPSISLGSCSLRVPRNLLIGNFNHNLSTLLCHAVCRDQGMMPVPTLRNHGGGDAQEIRLMPEPQNY